MKKWLEKLYRYLGIEINFATHNYVLEYDDRLEVVWGCETVADNRSVLIYYADVYYTNGIKSSKIYRYILPEGGYRAYDRTKVVAHSHIRHIAPLVEPSVVNMVVVAPKRGIQDKSAEQLYADLEHRIKGKIGVTPERRDTKACYYKVDRANVEALQRLAKAFGTSAYIGDTYNGN